MGHPSRYPEEFQREAVELYRSSDRSLERLRRENRELRMDREILRKAAAYFARETNR